MFRAALTRDEIDRQQRVMGDALGHVSVSLMTGIAVRGVVVKETISNADGYRAGFALLDETDRETLIDALDVALVAAVPPTQRMIDLLRRKGMWDDSNEN